MEVTVNHKKIHVPPECNVKSLLTDVLRYNTSGLAVAAGDVIIPRNQWENHFLSSGDHLVIIKATQGG